MTSSRPTWLWMVLLALVVGPCIPDSAFPQTYIKAGIMLDRAKDTRFQDENCSSSEHLYGCGAGIDGDPLSSFGDFDTITGLELGLGYAVLPALRLEAAVQYRSDFAFEGHANFSGPDLADRQDVSAELSVLSGMLATYLDVPLPGFALLRYTPINPFIGVGGGLSRIDMGESRMNFPDTSTIVPGGHHISFSWMLTAGLAVSLTRWTVDVAWRYTDHGGIETASGTGRKFCRVASCNLPEVDLPIAPTRGDLKSHGLTVSLRYAF